jgi:transcriptional regulator with XRE-family HTH domain
MNKERRSGARASQDSGANNESEPSSVGSFIRRQREMANLSLRKVAERSGVSAAVIREIESGLRHPSSTLLQSLAAALRLSAETLYLQAGVLDPKDVGQADAVREILRDPNLTERQRDILVEIYAAFRVLNRDRAESSLDAEFFDLEPPRR